MRALQVARQPVRAMSQDKRGRSKTGQALKGRLLQQLVEQSGAGAVFPAGAQLGQDRWVVQ